MSEKTMEEFEAWADEKGFCLDQTFMSTEGVPENPYHDGDTKLAYEIWCASRSPGCSLALTRDDLALIRHWFIHAQDSQEAVPEAGYLDDSDYELAGRINNYLGFASPRRK